MKLKFLFYALKDQLPVKRMFRNFFITGNAWGIFSKYSHFKKDGIEKVSYNTRETAVKSAEKMEMKYNGKFRAYRCAHCGNFHIGKNRV
jgi:hypothetical protein